MRKTLIVGRPCWVVAALSLLFVISLGCTNAMPVKAPSVAAKPLPRLEPQEMPYRLQVGDTLAVKFWGNPELDEELLVRPDGRISLPFVDDVVAAGLTPEQLDAMLSQLFAGELKNPQITVIVRSVTGQFVYVSGEVRGGGAIAIDGRMTLLQAILQAGYFSEDARRRQVVVIRTLQDGTRVAGMVNMLPMISGENPAADILLQASDLVIVPQKRIRGLTQFIEKYFYDLMPVRVVGTVDLEELFGIDLGGGGGGAEPAATPAGGEPPPG